MKILTIIYNNDSKFILDIVSNIKEKLFIESYNISVHKDKKKAIPVMTRFGTSNVPLLVFADENLEEISAIWSEEKPDWKKAIMEHLEQMGA